MKLLSQSLLFLPITYALHYQQDSSDPKTGILRKRELVSKDGKTKVNEQEFRSDDGSTVVKKIQKKHFDKNGEEQVFESSASYSSAGGVGNVMPEFEFPRMREFNLPDVFEAALGGGHF